MTAAEVKKFRDDLYVEGQPLIVWGDNLLVFYDNSQDHFPIIWDDGSETLTQVMINDQVNEAQVAPFKVVTMSYECIQYLSCSYTIKDTLKFVDTYGASWTDEQKEQVNKLIQKAALHTPRSGPSRDNKPTLVNLNGAYRNPEDF